jgi:hypothetical protein
MGFLSARGETSMVSPRTSEFKVLSSELTTDVPLMRKAYYILAKRAREIVALTG